MKKHMSDSPVFIIPDGKLTNAILRRAKNQWGPTLKALGKGEARTKKLRNSRKLQKKERFAVLLEQATYRSPLDNLFDSARYQGPKHHFFYTRTPTTANQQTERSVAINSLVIMRVTGTDTHLVIKDTEKSKPGFVIGGIDPGMSELATARMESMQEANIEADEERFIKIGNVPLDNHQHIAVFYLEITEEEMAHASAGRDQTWVRQGTDEQIRRAIAANRFLPNHARAESIYENWRKSST